MRVTKCVVAISAALMYNVVILPAFNVNWKVILIIDMLVALPVAARISKTIEKGNVFHPGKRDELVEEGDYELG